MLEVVKFSQTIDFVLVLVLFTTNFGYSDSFPEFEENLWVGPFLKNNLKAGLLTRSNFGSQFLLRFKDVSDANQHFYELKQCQKSNCIKNWII